MVVHDYRKLVVRKQFASNLTTLVLCLPIDELPEYLTNDDPNVREAAKIRFDELATNKPPDSPE